MNLTTKRMLQFMTVCAGASALSASAATQWVADSFEDPAGSANLPIDQYKMNVTGELGETTNRLWFSESGDASKIITGESVYGQVRPMQVASPNNDYVLNLETEGTTLSRTNNTENQSFATASVFVDTLIKFTPSEDTPTIEGGVKVAVYVNVSSNLVVYHKGYDEELGYIGTNSVVTTVPINCDDWHRLTIEMGKPPAVGAACRIYLDGGAAIVHANGYTEANVANGEWFKSAGIGNDLSTIAFQGTGKLDELVVADAIPGTTPSGILLTLKFTDYVAMIDVTTNGVAVEDMVQVPNDTAVLITAKPWYEIYDVGTLFTGSVTNATVGTMATAISGMVSSGQSGTNEFKARLYSDTGSISTGLGGSYPADKVADWATTHAGGEYPLTSDMLDDYLLNVDDGTNAKLKINSITLGATLAEIKVGATSELVNLLPAALNGTLVVYTTEDLATPFSYISSFDITLETASEVTITVPLADGKFIKAVVQ